MEPAWGHDALKAWFEARRGDDVAETDLLRAFFPNDEVFTGVDLVLFQKHFLLYRRLWLFDDELRQSTGQRLWIRGIRSTLLDPPPVGLCRWLDPDAGTFCARPVERDHLCASHAAPLPEANGVKAYYLDWANLEGMTEERLQTMIDGFFRWMGRQGSRSEALVVLGLEPDAPQARIKERWRELSLQHHPDRGGDPEVYKKISAAWTALKTEGEDSL